MKGTVKELSEQVGVSYTEMNGGVKTLLALGMANVVRQKEKPAGKRGRTSKIYEIEVGNRSMTVESEEE